MPQAMHVPLESPRRACAAFPNLVLRQCRRAGGELCSPFSWRSARIELWSSEQQNPQGRGAGGGLLKAAAAETCNYDEPQFSFSAVSAPNTAAKPARPSTCRPHAGEVDRRPASERGRVGLSRELGDGLKLPRMMRSPQYSGDDRILRRRRFVHAPFAKTKFRLPLPLPSGDIAPLARANPEGRESVRRPPAAASRLHLATREPASTHIALGTS
jgi:hypothetical protein